MEKLASGSADGKLVLIGMPDYRPVVDEAACFRWKSNRSRDLLFLPCFSCSCPLAQRVMRQARGMDVAWVALGAGAGALAVWLTAKEAARRRGRFPSYEVWAWAAFLAGAALIYVGFAVFNGASAEWTWTELGGLAGYGLVAWIGAARFAPLVGVGWLLHVLWDVALHPGGHPGFVPSWYPPLCLGFDVYVGVVLVGRFRGLRLVESDDVGAVG